MKNTKSGDHQNPQAGHAVQAGTVCFHLLALLGLFGSLALAGCGAKTAPDVPIAGVAPQYNTYIGTQSVGSVSGLNEYTSSYGGVWSASIDDQSNFFNYLNTGHKSYGGNSFEVGGGPNTIPQANPILGGTGSAQGFLALTPTGQAPGSGGYALEVPGQTLVLRPGNNTVDPVVMVETSKCLSLTKPTTYQFVAFGDPNPATSQKGPLVAYGSLQASNQDVNWNFPSLKMYAFDGTDLKPAHLPNGACAETIAGYAINIPAPSATEPSQTMQISPTGHFFLDQGQGSLLISTNAGLSQYPGPTGPVGLVGVQQPSSPLSVSSIVGGRYLGFEYNPLNAYFSNYPSLDIVAAPPVMFGLAGSTGNVLVGGTYPNDDLTQTPSPNISIDLGQQDAQNNGLFKSVTVTQPDTYRECIQTPYGGNDAQGNPTCIYQGAAVAGNPGGHFALYVTVQNLGAQARHAIKFSAINFFLYQQ